MAIGAFLLSGDDIVAIFEFFKLYLEKISEQSSSQSCLVDMRELALKLFRTWPCRAWLEGLDNRWSVVVCIGFM